jgi:hypothetical protein
LIGIVLTGILWLRGASAIEALDLAGLTISVCGVILLLTDVLRPVWGRRHSLRHAEMHGPKVAIWHILRGAPPIGFVLLPRLEQALMEFRSPAPVRPMEDSDVQRAQTRAAIDAEMRRFPVFPQPDIVLGRAAAQWNNPAARLGQLARSGADPRTLPRVLQIGRALEQLAAAVCVFDRLAVVLPVAAPISLTTMPGGQATLWRRSRRERWWETLQVLDDSSPAFEFAIDLAPSPLWADRLLAGRVAEIREAARRHAAITAMGPDRFMAVLRPRLVQEDAFGQLYQIGPREAPSAFVAVRDQVLGPDGTRLTHWISVPPHVATAREAVAWTFGMSEAEYRPTHES